MNYRRNLDEGLAEAISTILWASPRIQTDVQEMKVISDILTSKYGRQYTDACREESIQTISEKLKHKLGVQSPSKLLVEKYLIEIAKNYNVEYEPDPQVMAEAQDALLIDVDNSGGDLPNNFDLASGGGPPQPAGFIGFPQPPLLPDPGSNMNFMNSGGGGGGSGEKNVGPAMGFVSPAAPLVPEKDQNVPFNPAALSYNIPLDNANTNKPVSLIILMN